MYLILSDAETRGVRTTYAATSCAHTYYPKRAGRDAEVDGMTIEFKITGSRNYATAATAGNNAYFQLDGKTYWISFDAGFNAHEESLEFTTHEGSAPDKNPEREPKNPAKEQERRQNLSTALKAKFASQDSQEAADDLQEATATQE